ncbi:MAG: hypothetical protein ACOY5U_11085 [Pseudomonadota bacterium]
MRALAIAALLAASPAFADWVPVKPSTDPDPIVKVEGETLTYIGGINATGLTKLSNAVRHLPRGQVTKMIVNSGGGDTKAGIFIGSIIADLKPDLTIEVGCFSSCADFIAPGANSITIRENAFLGWHGNDRGFQITADQPGLPLRDYLRGQVADQATNMKDDAGNPMDLEAWLDEAVGTLQALIVEEKTFYDGIGIADTFAICGVGPRFDNRLSGAQLGWGFSIADMARLGLPPVRYEGPGAYEDNPAFRYWLIRLTPEDCTP